MTQKIKYTGVVLTAFFAVILTSSDAQAQNLGDFFLNLSQNTALIDISNLVAYVLGTLLVALGFYKAKNHIEFGPQSVPTAEPFKYLLAGGMLLGLPFMAGIVTRGFGDGGAIQDINGLNFNADAAAAGGLDNMMINFIDLSYEPFQLLVTLFCYVAGAMLLVIAIHRFTKTAQEGPRGPTGLGTIATFMLAGALFSVGPMVGMFVETLFGGRDSAVDVEFMALDAGEVGSAHAQNVVVAILGFLIVVGILSILRGFFILRGVAEGGQQMTMMGGISHVIAGAILVNFGQFANIIQNTLGVDTFGVLFS